jgi:hypothetical protein
MAGFADEPGRRADEDERPVALELVEEPAGRQEGRREVDVDRLAPALQR